jgi:hypothetical protein
MLEDRGGESRVCDRAGVRARSGSDGPSSAAIAPATAAAHARRWGDRCPETLADARRWWSGLARGEVSRGRFESATSLRFLCGAQRYTQSAVVPSTSQRSHCTANKPSTTIEPLLHHARQSVFSAANSVLGPDRLFHLFKTSPHSFYPHRVSRQSGSIFTTQITYEHHHCTGPDTARTYGQTTGVSRGV